MSQPLVYCLILNWNGKDFLAATLASLQKLDYPHYELLLVDNGSSDGSARAAAAQYPHLILFENEKNLGYGEGNNVGMRYALQQGAEWILLLNNDVEVAPDFLSEMIKVGSRVERCGMLGPKIYYHDQPHKIWFAGGRINFWTGVTAHRGLREIDHGQYDEIVEADYLTGCCLLIHRAVLEKIGLFDPVYFPAYGEDADLCLRARQAGYRLLYVPTAKIWHKVSSSSGGGLTPFKTKLKVQHNWIFFKRYAKWYHWLTIPWCIAGLAAVFVAKEIRKGNFGVVAALLQGFKKGTGELKIQDSKHKTQRGSEF